MKVLQINVTFPQGSTGKIVYDLHVQLQSNGIESYVIHGRGDSKEKNCERLCSLLYCRVQKLKSIIFGTMYGGCFLSTNKIIKRIKKIKPDVVHLHCINGNFVNVYRLINWLKINNIKTVITLHAEFLYTANCGHAFECDKWKTGCGRCPSLKQQTGALFFDRTAKSWQLMFNSFKGFDKNLIIASVSGWLMNRAKESPIMCDKKHVVVNNGLNDEIFHYRNMESKKREMGLTNKKIIFHVTPSFSTEPSNIKGGQDIIKLAKLLNDKKDIVILVAGPNYCKEKLPSNIISLGRITNQIELAELYSMADLTIIVSKRETFSMVTIESLSCGTPIVGYKAGGPESIALEKYSQFTNNGDYMAMAKVCCELLKNSFDKEKISIESLKRYSKEYMAEKYLELYRELLKEAS